MLNLPPSLERRLSAMFPRMRDRDAFVVASLTRALDEAEDDDYHEYNSYASPSPTAMADREEVMPGNIGGTLHLFTDGGSRGNPGQAAIGCILEDPVQGVVLEEHYERIGIETNNVAEYRALIAGLKLAARYQPNRLICHLDSELIVRQLNGEYQVKMETLKRFYDEIISMVSNFSDVLFVHIPREDNYRADALVNRALDEMPAPGRVRHGTVHHSPNRPMGSGKW